MQLLVLQYRTLSFLSFATIHLLCTKTIHRVLFSSLVFAGSRVKVIAGNAANQYFPCIRIIKATEYVLHTNYYFAQL